MGSEMCIRDRVGAVGSILAECGVNIARFALGRGPGGAVSVISIDDSMDSGNRELDQGLLDTLRAVPAIKSAQLVRI